MEEGSQEDTISWRASINQVNLGDIVNLKGIVSVCSSHREASKYGNKSIHSCVNASTSLRVFSEHRIERQAFRMEPHSFLATSAFLLFLQVTISTSQVIDRSLCKDHPAFDNSLNPVLIRSWANGGSLPKVEQVAYLPRYIGHGYTPIEDPSSKKYIALDLFHTANAMRAPNIRVNFQRAALVYMFVNVDSTEFNKTLVATLPGWQSEGWAKRSFGGNNILYGVYEKLSRKMSTYVYVFSKTTTQDNFVEIPQSLFVKVRIEGISATGSFNLWIAESDGSGSKPVGKFNGKDVEPNKKCPNELHDAWRVKFENPADPSTKGVLFRTWHPQWDPCFWWYVYILFGCRSQDTVTSLLTSYLPASGEFCSNDSIPSLASYSRHQYLWTRAWVFPKGFDGLRSQV